MNYRSKRTKGDWGVITPPKFLRGMFRLWVVLSVVWISCVTFASFRTIETEFARGEKRPSPAGLWLPVQCDDRLRGVEGNDYVRNRYACWYQSKAFRIQYPEYSDLEEGDLENRLYEKLGLIDAWQRVLNASILACAPPIAALFMSAALYWVLAGFRGKPKI